MSEGPGGKRYKKSPVRAQAVLGRADTERGQAAARAASLPAKSHLQPHWPTPTLQSSGADFRIHAASQVTALSSLFTHFLCLGTPFCPMTSTPSTPAFQGPRLCNALPESGTSPALNESLHSKSRSSSKGGLYLFPQSRSPHHA